MKIKLLFSTGASLMSATVARATYATWQAAVTGAGTAPATTLFATTNGASPILFNVGTLSDGRSFEFIVNSGPNGLSQAFMGTQVVADGRQGLKFEQWQDTGRYGMTDFGVLDYDSGLSFDTGRNVHVVFTTADLASTTDMYIDGVFQFTFPTPLRMTGVQGIAAATNATQTGFFDNMDGDVLGFVSYDSALSAAEIDAHYAAFVIPEPSAVTCTGLVSLAALLRRRQAAQPAVPAARSSDLMTQPVPG